MIYYLLSGRTLADLRYLRYFSDGMIGQNLNFSVINNVDPRLSDQVIVTYGYLGYSKKLLENQDICSRNKIVVLDNPMLKLGQKVQLSYRVQDNLMNIKAVSEQSPFLNSKRNGALEYFKNFKKIKHKYASKSLVLASSLPHLECIRLSNKGIDSMYDELLANHVHCYGYDPVIITKANAIEKIDRNGIPLKRSPGAKDSPSLELYEPIVVAALQSSFIYQFQIAGIKTVSTKYNPFHTAIDLENISFEERCAHLADLYASKTFLDSELAEYLRNL
jgi:hypothetical protein